jgi:hypothetical protein
LTSRLSKPLGKHDDLYVGGVFAICVAFCYVVIFAFFARAVSMSRQSRLARVSKSASVLKDRRQTDRLNLVVSAPSTPVPVRIFLELCDGAHKENCTGGNWKKHVWHFSLLPVHKIDPKNIITMNNTKYNKTECIGLPLQPEKSPSNEIAVLALG